MMVSKSCACILWHNIHPRFPKTNKRTLRNQQGKFGDYTYHSRPRAVTKKKHQPRIPGLFTHWNAYLELMCVLRKRRVGTQQLSCLSTSTLMLPCCLTLRGLCPPSVRDRKLLTALLCLLLHQLLFSLLLVLRWCRLLAVQPLLLLLVPCLHLLLHLLRHLTVQPLLLLSHLLLSHLHLLPLSSLLLLLLVLLRSKGTLLLHQSKKAHVSSGTINIMKALL